MASSSKLTAEASTAKNDLPEIDFWYGEIQRFGHLGNPQPLINVLGSIKPVALAKDASYRLNNGKITQLTLGSDLHRLARDGDFNIEIERADLKQGEDTLLIKTRTPHGRDVSREISIIYDDTERTLLPFDVDFTNVADLQDVVEVIDGK